MKSKRLFVRMTPEELASLKNRAVGFNSVSHFVKEAIKYYSGQSPKERIDTRRKIAQLLSNADNHLAHIGGNLNQAMHRCNEASKAGLPNSHIILYQVLPKIEDCYSLLVEIRKDLFQIVSSK